MGFLDRLFGRSPKPEQQPTYDQYGSAGRANLSEDEQAVERYRYLLRTAPPDTVEAAHAEAFAQLTPEQRQMVLQELSRELPPGEQAGQYSDDPRSLARMATRAEMRRPGTLERSFGGMGGGGMGMGSMIGGSFLGSFAGIMIGSAVAQSFFDSGGDSGDSGGGDSGDSGDSADAGGEGGDAGGDAGGDSGFGDGGGDFGGDFGGGDFGGGDFGGGEF